MSAVSVASAPPPVVLEVVCGSCGRKFEAKTTRARFCSNTCRSRNRRRAGGVRPKTPAAPSGGSQAAEGAEGSPPGSAAAPAPEVESRFEVLTREELERLDAVDTLLGQHVLLVARRVARGADGLETAAGFVSLSRDHSRLMAEIRATKGTGVDPLQAAREAASAVARDAAAS